MIDWHSHILPGIDDGSGSVEESLLMLKLLREQGAETVIATPHFYADADSVDSFIAKRQKAFEALSVSLNGEHPEVLLGAEVCYYPGISKLTDLKRLCIQGTDLLLIEMPVARWTQHTVNEIIELACSGSVVVVIAHVDRYLEFQSASVISKMCDIGIIMQLNSGFFDNFFNRRKAFKLLENGIVRIIGSDCHNLSSRKPSLDRAFMYIQKKFGNDFISMLDEYGYTALH